VPLQRAVRVPFSEKVFVYSDNRMVMAQAGDLSETGMLLHPQAPLSVGGAAWLRFSLPGSTVELDGRLVREAPEQDRYALAVQFNAVPAAVQKQIEDLVDRRLDGAPRPSPKAAPDLLTLYQQALAQIEREERADGAPRLRRRATAR